MGIGQSRWLEGDDASKEWSDPREEPVVPPRPAHADGSGRRRFPDATAYEMDRWRATGGRLAPKYGISEERYWEIVKEQGWRCAICAVHLTAAGPRTAIDHNHDTGQVRGILCSLCNTSLGGFRDSPDVLRAALRYLTERGCYGPDTEPK